MIIKWKSLIINILIPIVVGLLSAISTKDSMDIYKDIILPPLSPPSFLFPIVWTILFVLIGIASYVIWESTNVDIEKKKTAFTLYGLDLIVNFIWTIVFFNLRNYDFSVFIIIMLLLIIVANIFSFGSISKRAAWLLVPYLMWVSFATYLNIAIAVLN